MPVHRWKVQQNCKPSGALNKRADRRLVESNDQVAFPVSRHCPVFSLGRALANHDLWAYEASSTTSSSSSWNTQRPTRSQTRYKLASYVAYWELALLGRNLARDGALDRLRGYVQRHPDSAMGLRLLLVNEMSVLEGQEDRQEKLASLSQLANALVGVATTSNQLNEAAWYYS